MNEQTTLPKTDTNVNNDTAAANQACPNCGMPKEDWRGNGGEGFQMGTNIYCCQGCATGTGCTCQ
jgi:hypothetical protein